MVKTKTIKITVCDRKLYNGDWEDSEPRSVSFHGKKELNKYYRDYIKQAAEYRESSPEKDCFIVSPELENEKFLEKYELTKFRGKKTRYNRIKSTLGPLSLAVFILFLFGIYNMLFQDTNAPTGYCIINSNTVVAGIALIVIILLFVLISTRKMGKEIIRYVPIKRKVTSKKKK